MCSARDDLQRVEAMSVGVPSLTEARLDVCHAILAASLASSDGTVTAATVRLRTSIPGLAHRVGATFAALRVKDIIRPIPGAVAASGNASAGNRQRLMPVYSVDLAALTLYMYRLEHEGWAA